MTPLAVVGASWRTASTLARARLAQLASEPEPLATLRNGGYASGVACVSTCSRTEWVLTTEQPEWAARLLQSALSARVPELRPDDLHVRVGPAAAHYLLRVSVGLDSVAEGEAAVGRQLLKAFEDSRARGTSDPRLNRVRRHVERLGHERRETVPSSRSLGVQALVRAALLEAAPRRIAIVGRGDFGQAMERSLRGASDWDVTTFNRASLGDLFKRLPSLDAVVVCTSASEPWLELPAKSGGALCIDASSPPQVRSAPGWKSLGLDHLLARPELQLPEVERVQLEALVTRATGTLVAALDAHTPATRLAAIDAERTAFLNEQLPELLAGLPARDARRVRKAVGAFTHRLLLMTREAS